jgi:hypothetical protein
VHRRALVEGAGVIAGALGIGIAPASVAETAAFDPKAEQEGSRLTEPAMAITCC